MSCQSCLKGYEEGQGGLRAGLRRGQGKVRQGQGGVRRESATLAMGTEAWIAQGRGQPVALLWLLLLPVATLELRGSPATATATATAAPGWAPGAGGAVEGSAPTPEAQRLAPGATGGRGVSTVCGKPKVMGKIYGGQDVVAGQWPWQASLQYQGSHVCGAVLINSHWVVSTAHCFLKKSHAPENYRVLLGSTQMHQHTQHTREMSLSRIIMHPDFEKLHPFGSDIAMLQLLFPVNFTSYIIPACLPVPGMQLPSNSSCWITGWGMLNEETPLPEPFHLQEGKVGFTENKFCNIFYGLRKGKNFSVHEDMLCAGDFSTGKAICQAEDTIELDTQEPQHMAPPAPLSLSVTTACLRGSI
ncbi:serine protease 40-like [Eschrichtius robustus]|uniref:serine protease 40-like n=1 Tax=Eschrichtius robustus TaxID=9764 RepID=UPI0035C0F3D5